MDLPKQHRGTNLASTNTLHDRVFCSQMEKYILRFCWTTKKWFHLRSLRWAKQSFRVVSSSCCSASLPAILAKQRHWNRPCMRSGEKSLPWKQNDLNWRHFVLGQGMHLWRHSSVPVICIDVRTTNDHKCCPKDTLNSEFYDKSCVYVSRCFSFFPLSSMS